MSKVKAASLFLDIIYETRPAFLDIRVPISASSPHRCVLEHPTVLEEATSDESQCEVTIRELILCEAAMHIQAWIRKCLAQKALVNMIAQSIRPNIPKLLTILESGLPVTAKLWNGIAESCLLRLEMGDVMAASKLVLTPLSAPIVPSSSSSISATSPAAATASATALAAAATASSVEPIEQPAQQPLCSVYISDIASVRSGFIQPKPMSDMAINIIVISGHAYFEFEVRLCICVRVLCFVLSVFFFATASR